MKTDIEIREKTNSTVFVLGWPFSIPEVSVWIAVAHQHQLLGLTCTPSRFDLTGKPAGSAVV